MSRPTQPARYHAPRRFLFASLGAALLAVAAAGAAQAQCVGDCDGNCDVGISELIRGVSISLGSQALDGCPAFDADGDGMVAINELIRGVGNALGGCGEQCSAGDSPTPTPSPTGSPSDQTPSPPVTPVTSTPTPAASTATPVPSATPTMSNQTRTATLAPTPPGGLKVDSAANAPDPWTVRVSFNGIVEAFSGTNISNYEIREKNRPDAGGPQIVDVQFLRTCDGGVNDGRTCNDTAGSLFTNGAAACPGGACSVEDHRAVVLTTGAQALRDYIVRVSNVRDTQGNSIQTSFLGDRYLNEASYVGKDVTAFKHCAAAMQQKTLETGRCYPLPCSTDADCPDAAIGSCRNAIPDCDGDALNDRDEVLGWDVTVTNSNGKTTNHVTSNPLVVDTDGDGLSDAQEKSSPTGSVSDPRNTDTDGDGELDDYQEVVLLRSDPANTDTDGDGVSDRIEVKEYKSSPTAADSDGDSIPDGADYQSNMSDPRFADLPAFEIRVDNPTVKFDYKFTFTQNMVKTGEETGNVTATLSDMSSESKTTVDTTVKEWSAKSALHAEAGAAYPLGFTASAKVTVDADVGASGRNEVTKQKAQTTAKELQRSNTFMRTLMSGETAERTVSGAQVTANVRFLNTGAFAMCLDNIIINMRTPDPENPGEFIALGALTPIGLNMPIELGPLTTMHSVQFSASLDGQSLEAVQRLMQNPRSIIFDVGNFTVRSDPSGMTPKICDAPSYVTVEQSIVNNTGEVTVDFAGEDDRAVQHLFLSSNLGRQEAVRDRNGDGTPDPERVIFLPDGTYLYPRLTDALDAANIDYMVDPISGQFTSVGGIANETAPHRKAWIILIRNDKRGTSRLSNSDIRYCGQVSPDCPDGPTRVDDVAIAPGVQIWISYLQDEDNDGVPRSTEDLYGTSDDNHDITDEEDINCQGKHPTGTTDSDCDGVSDFDEIYGSVAVSVTNRVGEQVPFEAHSNPVLYDTDGDSVPDAVERTNHTAPDRPDTDGDGLTDDVDPDPLVFGCVPRVFHFEFNSQIGDCGGIGCYLFPAGLFTQEAKTGCSVTVSSPALFRADIGGFLGSGMAPVISVSGFKGYGSCKLIGCESSCNVTDILGTTMDREGYCAPDNGPRCPLVIYDTFHSSKAIFDVQCSN